jgi:hypothetical protein
MTPLLDRRLLLVSGKGGVGKSTVALVLCRLAARRGRRVVLDCIGMPAPALAGLASASLEGGRALDEYLGRMLPGPLSPPGGAEPALSPVRCRRSGPR